MTALNQDEIVCNAKTVIQGLDTLKNDYQQILNTLLSSMKTIKRENGDTNLVEEKTNILQRSLETIELGLGEGQVRKLLVMSCIGGFGVDKYMYYIPAVYMCVFIGFEHFILIKNVQQCHFFFGPTACHSSRKSSVSGL